MSLRLYDMRDLDLMFKLREVGGITSKELAEELGLAGDNAHSQVGVRMSWMRRFGMVDFSPKGRTWSLSHGGGRVVESKIRAAMQQELLEIPDEQMIEVMSHVTTRWRLGDPMVAAMLRREFLFGTQRGVSGAMRTLRFARSSVTSARSPAPALPSRDGRGRCASRETSGISSRGRRPRVLLRATPPLQVRNSRK